MPALLDLSRSRAQLKRQLVRRIGYTEGLFDILRIADLVGAIGPALPMPIAEFDRRLRTNISSRRDAPVPPPGRAYGEGIRNVVIALGFLERVGNRVALAPAGRALVATSVLRGSASTETRTLLTFAVIDSDGDYFLNLLMGDPRSSLHAAGSEMLTKVHDAIVRKRSWVDESTGPRVVRDYALSELAEISASLVAGRPARKGAPREGSGLTLNTLRHTVSPRRGWISALMLDEPRRLGYVARTLRDTGQMSDGTVALGIQSSLVTLGLTGFPATNASDIFRLAADGGGDPIASTRQTPSQLLGALETSYHLLRLKSFNQLELESLYYFWGASLAASGNYVSEQEFQLLINEVVNQSGGRIWRLSAPRPSPLGGYLAMRDALR